MAFAALVLIVLTAVITAVAVSIDPALDLQLAVFFQTPGVRAALAPLYPWFDTLRDCNVALSSAFVVVAVGTLVIKRIRPQQRNRFTAALSRAAGTLAAR